MRNQIDIFREVFEDWLMINEFDYDYSVYSKEEWKEKEDDRLWGEPELVFIFENEHLSGCIDGYCQIPGLGEELDALFEGFGFYMYWWDFQVCGFYPLEDYEKPPYTNSSYQTLSSDKRWQKKRERILDRCLGICENCGVINEFIEVHHCYYRYGRYPWQYPDQTLVGLCQECHEERHKIEFKWRIFQPQLKNKEISNLQNFIKNFIYWNDDKRPPNPFTFNKRNRLSKFIEILSKWSQGFQKSLFFDLVQELLMLINELDHPEDKN